MKHFMPILLLLTACGGSGGTSNTPSSVTNPNPVPPVIAPTEPIVTPVPTPMPTPTPIACANPNITKWVADGAPTLTAQSQDQLGFTYIPTLDFSVNNPTFTETQHSGGIFSCVRTFNQGIATYPGATDSYVWNTGVGAGCSAVVNWLQFNTTVCNVLTVTLRAGDGSIYETQKYKPAL